MKRTYEVSIYKNDKEQVIILWETDEWGIKSVYTADIIPSDNESWTRARILGDYNEQAALLNEK
jgi:hypothetical protein